MKLDPANLDRRVIYLVVLLALSLPLLLKYTVRPARMVDAERAFAAVQQLGPEQDQYAFAGLEVGPSTQAENVPQAEVVIEHLMRQRIPIIFFSLYYLAEPFLKAIPERVAARLEREYPGQRWEYGRDWLNLGYRPGGSLMLQAIPKSANLAELFGMDVYGNRISELPAFANLRTIRQIKFLVQVSGLVGMLDTYIRFFKTKDHTPLFVHGCTSITIPEAFIYLDSGQITGLLGGIAGAAWYSELLSKRFGGREPDSSLVINTSLGVAHLVVIAFILAGNLAMLRSRRA